MSFASTMDDQGIAAKSLLKWGLFAVFTILSWITEAQFVISGKVVDRETFEPLAFAVVAEESSRNSTFSDTDGNFSLEISDSTAAILTRLVGYENLRIHANIHTPLALSMQRVAHSIQEIIILPGINPAETLIQKAISRKRFNDPLQRPFACDSYFKLLVGQSTEPSGQQTIFSESTDTSAIALQKFLNERHLFLMETAVHSEYAPPGKKLDRIKGHRVSGVMQSADIFLMAYQLQDLSPYKESFNVMGKNFTAPLADRAFNKYRYFLEDSVVQGEDTLFGIRFWPRKRERAYELSGKLYLHHEDFAIVNFTASLPDSSDLKVKINQQFKRHQPQHWFPDQIDTYLTFENIKVTNQPLEGFSKQYFQNVDFHPSFETGHFNHVTVLADQYFSTDSDSLWKNERVVDLTEKEWKTYKTIDSLGRVAKLDQKLQRFNALARGSLKLGIIDWSINNFIAYNPYEKIRICADVRTSNRISSRWSVGGYTAYGTGDKRWKYGGDILLKISRERELQVNFKFKEDVFESGGNALAAEKYEPLGIDLYRIFTSRMDWRTRWEFSVSAKIWRTLSGKCMAIMQKIVPFENMAFKATQNENVTLYVTEFLNTEYALELRWAPGEKIMKTRQGEIKLQGHMPILRIRFGIAPDQSSLNDFGYQRLDFRAQKQFNLQGLGKLSATLVAGAVNKALPLSLIYNARGAFRNFAPLSSETFHTMRTNEFQHNQFTSLFVRHDFKSLHFGPKGFAIQPAIKGSFIVGNASEKMRYEFNQIAAEKGFFETGIEINQLIRSGSMALGLGVSYRMGRYSLERKSENFAYLLTLTSLLQ